jgi:hypothetical protein
MKIASLVLIPIGILLLSFADKDPVYTVQTTPFQDTLLTEVDNTLEIFVDGQPTTIVGCELTVDGATLGPSYIRRGLYIAKTFERDTLSHAELTLKKDGKILLNKKFVIPVMTAALRKRADAVIEAQKKK